MVFKFTLLLLSALLLGNAVQCQTSDNIPNSKLDNEAEADSPRSCFGYTGKTGAAREAEFQKCLDGKGPPPRGSSTKRLEKANADADRLGYTGTQRERWVRSQMDSQPTTKSLDDTKSSSTFVDRTFSSSPSAITAIPRGDPNAQAGGPSMGPSNTRPCEWSPKDEQLMATECGFNDVGVRNLGVFTCGRKLNANNVCARFCILSRCIPG